MAVDSMCWWYDKIQLGRCRKSVKNSLGDGAGPKGLMLFIYAPGRRPRAHMQYPRSDTAQKALGSKGPSLPTGRPPPSEGLSWRLAAIHVIFPPKSSFRRAKISRRNVRNCLWYVVIAFISSPDWLTTRFMLWDSYFVGYS